MLEAGGFRVTAVATEAAGSAAAQVREAIADGVEYVFACGGDGTVHDVLQGLVDEARGGAALPVLGVIPMGSANALARHLGLSMNAVEAAEYFKIPLSTLNQKIKRLNVEIKKRGRE